MDFYEKDIFRHFILLYMKKLYLVLRKKKINKNKLSSIIYNYSFLL